MSNYTSFSFSPDYDYAAYLQNVYWKSDFWKEQNSQVFHYYSQQSMKSNKIVKFCYILYFLNIKEKIKKSGEAVLVFTMFSSTLIFDNPML